MKSSAFAALLMAIPIVHAHGDKHADKQHEKAFVAAEAEQKTYGVAGNPGKASRTVQVSMSDDMRFSPSSIRVRQGETIKFVVANKGKVLHELVIGTREELDKHAEMMRKFPAMEHDEAHMAHVAAGKTEGLVWTFNRTGKFEFACLLPGHFEAGMKGNISVLPPREMTAGNPLVRAR